VRNGPAKAAKTQTSTEWFLDRNPAKLSTGPESSLDPSASLRRMKPVAKEQLSSPGHYRSRYWPLPRIQVSRSGRAC
jgi:hypothetical protein